jgi:hypothetical protein
MAAATESRSRRSRRRLLLDGESADELIARGQNLKDGLRPLLEALEKRALALDQRTWTQDVIVLVACAVVLGASIAMLLA